jgi:HAD superfamily hydrolase (TIGR01549 family)
MSQLSSVKGILFDMHQTITDIEEGFLSLIRRIAKDAGVDLSDFRDGDLVKAFAKADDWFEKYQIEQDVDIHFGEKTEHWIEANRLMFRALGVEYLSDETLVSIESGWKEQLRALEILNASAKYTMFELHSRAYRIGVCTRRSDDPTESLKAWGLLEILSTVHWTSVPGYAKPNPYTLILASDEMGVNPLKCAYVGDSVEADILAAQRAGMIPILTTWARTDQAEKASEDVHVIDEISELLDLFPERN